MIMYFNAPIQIKAFIKRNFLCYLRIFFILRVGIPVSPVLMVCVLTLYIVCVVCM